MPSLHRMQCMPCWHDCISAGKLDRVGSLMGYSQSGRIIKGALDHEYLQENSLMKTRTTIGSGKCTKTYSTSAKQLDVYGKSLP